MNTDKVKSIDYNQNKVEQLNTLRENIVSRKNSDVIAFELRNLLIKETIKHSKKINQRLRAEEILRRQVALGALSDDDSNITSEDCDDNEALFAMMEDHDRKNHLIGLWKKAYLKGRAGASVIRFFADLARKIYLFGVSKKLEEFENEELYLKGEGLIYSCIMGPTNTVK